MHMGHFQALNPKKTTNITFKRIACAFVTYLKSILLLESSLWPKPHKNRVFRTFPVWQLHAHSPFPLLSSSKRPRLNPINSMSIQKSERFSPVVLYNGTARHELRDCGSSPFPPHQRYGLCLQSIFRDGVPFHDTRMIHALNTRASFLKCSERKVKELKVPSANLLVHVDLLGRNFENLTWA